MSNAEKAVLKQETVQFVRKVLTEVYGQQASESTVKATAKRVIDALPTGKIQLTETSRR